MRAVVQRVCQASVSVADEKIGEIQQGFLVLVGVMDGDAMEDAQALCKKLCGLRIFEDEQGKMNRSICDVQGKMLVVSQFTLAGDARKGNRPSFIQSAPPEQAQVLYQALCQLIRQQGVPVATGRFGADMQVSLINDGPVTILLDTKRLF